MYAKRITKIENETGLHARPASDFVNLAKNYASKITIQNINEAAVKQTQSLLLC